MPSWRSKDGWLFSGDSYASCQIDALKCEEPKPSARTSRRSGSAKRSGGVVRSLEGSHFSNYAFPFPCERLSGVFFSEINLESCNVLVNTWVLVLAILDIEFFAKDSSRRFNST
jgi:hypothetical protein